MGADGQLVTVSDLKKHFPVRRGIVQKTIALVRAVDGVSFTIGKGETLGLVGESGCGKTTLGRAVLRLIEPDSGEIIFDGENLMELNGAEMKSFRKEAQIVFQNPYSSLSPRMTVRHIVGDPMFIHDIAKGPEVEERVMKLLEKVGLQSEHIDRYPHEFSGGQRQRIAIARALSLNPRFVVLDEPTSSLDVSVQAHILNDLKRLQKEFGLTYLFISHNLSVIRHMSNRVAVMYLGKIVEVAETEELYKNPLHPYTQILLSSIPIPDPDAKPRRVPFTGEVPSPINPPSGCRFHTRCPYVLDKCSKEEPELMEVRKGHFVACHLMTSEA